ncbi:MAG: peptide deformylase [Alphaproteobacteria bacterium]|nr:MAG: peptide deformylase [Alphaproteobacteria bacterium]
MFKDFNIAQIGHPILRNKTKDIPINEIKSENTQKIIEKMIKTMRKHNGAGLAANQIYEPIRICIIEVLDNPRYKHLNTIPLKVLINPKVIIKKDTATFNSYEGCLSVPNLRGKVKRYNTINVTYYTMDAKKITEDIKGLESIVYQHEIDHLDGYLFTDKVEDNSTLVTYENYQKYYEEEYKKELKNFNNIAENLS